MNKFIILALLIFGVCQTMRAQTIVKGSGILYTSGAPTHTVNVQSECEFAIDTVSGFWYEYNRDSLAWKLAGFRVQHIPILAAPTYTPTDKQSLLVVNSLDSLYFYRAGGWRHVNNSDGYKIIKYNGTAVAKRSVANFVGSDAIGLLIADNAGQTDIQPYINSGSITSAMIANGTVSGADIATATILGGNIAQNSAATGQILKWNGTTWVAANDSSGGYYQTVQSNGTPVTQRTILNVANTDEITLTALDNTTKTDISAAINPASIVGTKIASSTITTSHIQNGTILFADWGQNSATTNQIPKWNGSAWAAAADVGATVAEGITNDAGTLKIGGSLTGVRTISAASGTGIKLDAGSGVSAIYGPGNVTTVNGTNTSTSSVSASGTYERLETVSGSVTTSVEKSTSSTTSLLYAEAVGPLRYLYSGASLNAGGSSSTQNKYSLVFADTFSTKSNIWDSSLEIFGRTRTTTSAPGIVFRRTRQSGTNLAGSGLNLASGNPLGRLYFSGTAAANTNHSAVISAATTEAHSGTAQGGKIVLSTTQNGSSSSTDRLTIDQNGDLIAHAYTSARTDTNTIYSLAGLDPSGKIIRKSAAGLAGDGNGIYSGDGTTPADLDITATDSISIRFPHADADNNIGFKIKNTNYDGGYGHLFSITDVQKLGGYNPSALVYTIGAQSNGGTGFGGDYLCGLDLYVEQPQVTTPYANISGIGVYNSIFNNNANMGGMTGVVASVEARPGSDGFIQDMYGMYYSGYISAGSSVKSNVLSANAHGVSHAGSDTVQTQTAMWIYQNTNTGKVNSKYNILMPAWTGMGYGKSRSIQSETRQPSYFAGAMHVGYGAESYVGTDSLSVIGPSKFVGNIRATEYGVGNKEAGDLSKTASEYLAGFATDGTVIEHTRIIKVSATLDFPNTAANNVSDLTVSVSGASDGDGVDVRVKNAVMTASGMYKGWVSSSGTVTVRYYAGVSGGNPPSDTFTIVVTK